VSIRSCGPPAACCTNIPDVSIHFPPLLSSQAGAIAPPRRIAGTEQGAQRARWGAQWDTNLELSENHRSQMEMEETSEMKQ
jgi:hypothetical protein